MFDMHDKILICMTNLPTSAESFPLHRYEPIKMIGSGGAGAVFLCHDKILRRDVCVKVLTFTREDRLVHFQNEAKVTAKLRHKNIVSILDFGSTDGGTPYMVLEYIDGIPGDVYLKQHRPVELETAIDIISQISEALSYSHQSGILHRDIKPSNILLRETETGIHASLIDFGIAMLEGDRGKTTTFQNKELVGTPRYMPPDVVLGYPYSERSEVYSVGCILYEMLFCKAVFLGSTAVETISLHAHSPIPAMNDTEVPKELKDVIRKCLSKQPDERFQSMDELAEAVLNAGQSISKSNSDGMFSTEDDLEEEQRGSSHARHGTRDAEHASASKIKSEKGSAWPMIAVVVLLIATGWTGFAFLNAEVGTTEKTGSKGSAGSEGSLGSSESSTDTASTVRESSIPGPPELPANLHGAGKRFQFLRSQIAPTNEVFALKKLDKGGLKIQASVDPAPITDKNLAELKTVTTKIDVLKLSDTTVTGVGFTQIPNVEIDHLEVENCPLSDEGLRTIASIRGLKQLSLKTSNFVTPKGMSQLANAKELNTIVVGGNPNILKSLYLIPSLSDVRIHNMHIGATEMSDLIKIPKLANLALSFDSVNASAFEELAKAKPMARLSFNHMPLNTETIVAIKKVHTRQLKFDYCEIEKPGLMLLAGDKRIVHFRGAFDISESDQRFIEDSFINCALEKPLLVQRKGLPELVLE